MEEVRGNPNTFSFLNEQCNSKNNWNINMLNKKIKKNNLHVEYNLKIKR